MQCFVSVLAFLHYAWHVSNQSVQHEGIQSNKTPTWCNTVQVLFLQSHSACFGRQAPIIRSRSSHHHIRDFVPNMVMWRPTCNYNTCTRGRRASFLILLMMVAWRPKHVEWLCRNKICTVLHQDGVLFDLYYDARKHKSKIQFDLLKMSTIVLDTCRGI